MSNLFQTDRPKVRNQYQGVIPSISNLTKQHLTQTAANNAFYSEAIKILQSYSDGDARYQALVIGIVNYFDYLINFQKLDQNTAATNAISQSCDGFLAGLVLQSPAGNGLNFQLRTQLEDAYRNLGNIRNTVINNIMPLVESERNGGTGVTLSFGGQPVRNSAATMMGATTGAGGINLTPTFGQQPVQNATDGGGIQMDLPTNPNASSLDSLMNQLATETKPSSAVVPNTTGYVVDTAVSNPANFSNLVIHMNNYELHKTFGLLEPKRPSDLKTTPMSVAVLDHQLNSTIDLNKFKALKGTDGLVSKDIQPQPDGGYRLNDIVMTYEEFRYADSINEEPIEVLKVSQADADRYTYTGRILQLFPEQDVFAKLNELKGKYDSGLMTHDRITDFVNELETVFSPTTVDIIADKISALATRLWRFNMQKVTGSFDSYFQEHAAATNALRNELDGNVRALWDGFPTYLMNYFFNLVAMGPLGGADDNGVFAYSVGYVRVGYRAFELPFGFDPKGQPDNQRGEYGLVLKESTPGLYKICQNLIDSHQRVLHHVIITNDGRVIEVMRPSAGECDRFYLKVLDRLF